MTISRTYSTAELSELLNVAHSTITIYARTGKPLKGYRINKVTRNCYTLSEGVDTKKLKEGYTYSREQLTELLRVSRPTLQRKATSGKPVHGYLVTRVSPGRYQVEKTTDQGLLGEDEETEEVGTDNPEQRIQDALGSIDPSERHTMAGTPEWFEENGIDPEDISDGYKHKGPDRRGNYRIEAKGTLVYVTHKKSNQTLLMLETEQVYAILEAYSEMGQNKQKNEVELEFGITKQDLDLLFRALAFTKKSVPLLPRDTLGRTEEELLDLLEARRQSRLYQLSVRRMRQSHEKKAYLFDNMDKHIQECLEAFDESLTAYQPPKVRARKAPTTEREVDDDLMLIDFTTDLHYAKLAPRNLSDNTSSREKTRHMLIETAYALRARTPQDPAAIATIIGSDMSHIDDYKGGTTRGTAQDVDGDKLSIISELVDAVLDKLTVMHTVFPNTELHIYKLAGNHDRWTTEALYAAVCAWARGKDWIKTPTQVRPENMEAFENAGAASAYQAFEWGVNSIMMHHGDGNSQPRDLSRVFSTAFPKKWGSAEFRLVLLGNLHHHTVRESDGIVAFLCPALSGVDAWTGMKYMGAGIPATMVLKISKKYGYAGAEYISKRALVHNFKSGT